MHVDLMVNSKKVVNKTDVVAKEVSIQLDSWKDTLSLLSISWVIWI